MKLNSSKMIILIFILILIIYIIKNAKIEDQTFVDPAIAESEVIQDEVYTRLEASQFIIEEIIREDQTPAIVKTDESKNKIVEEKTKIVQPDEMNEIIDHEEETERKFEYSSRYIPNSQKQMELIEKGREMIEIEGYDFPIIYS